MAKYLGFAKELKKLWNMKLTFIPVVIGALGTINEETGGLGNKRTCGDYPNSYIIEIGQSRGDIRRLAVSQTSVKNCQR